MFSIPSEIFPTVKKPENNRSCTTDSAKCCTQHPIKRERRLVPPDRLLDRTFTVRADAIGASLMRARLARSCQNTPNLPPLPTAFSLYRLGVWLVFLPVVLGKFILSCFFPFQIRCRIHEAKTGVTPRSKRRTSLFILVLAARFALVELKLKNYRITSDVSRFRWVSGRLPSDATVRVMDVIVSWRSYGTLKEAS